MQLDSTNHQQIVKSLLSQRGLDFLALNETVAAIVPAPPLWRAAQPHRVLDNLEELGRHARELHG